MSDFAVCEHCGLTLLAKDMPAHVDGYHPGAKRTEAGQMNDTKPDKPACPYCGREFDDVRARSGHIRWCDQNPNRKGAGRKASKPKTTTPTPKAAPAAPRGRVDLADVPVADLKAELVRRLTETRDQADRYLSALAD